MCIVLNQKQHHHSNKLYYKDNNHITKVLFGILIKNSRIVVL